MEPPQDFVKINSLAIKMNAISRSVNIFKIIVLSTKFIQNHKDYRNTINIKRKIPLGTNERKIYLPPSEFTYGRKNRTPTPVKDVINYEYARKAEEVIKMEYSAFMTEKTKVEKIQPKTTQRYTKLLEKKKMSGLKEEKPLSKLKMFQDVDSKVKHNLKTFKTYTEKKDNLDNLIEKVENELKTYEENREGVQMEQ